MKSNRCGGVRIESGRESLISSGGAAMLVQAAAVSGLAGELSRALSPWRMARSLHDPGKTALDLVVAIALGGDCLADAAVACSAGGIRHGGLRPHDQPAHRRPGR